MSLINMYMYNFLKIQGVKPDVKKFFVNKCK